MLLLIILGVPVAQLVERWPADLTVRGSRPAEGGTLSIHEPCSTAPAF